MSEAPESDEPLVPGVRQGHSPLEDVLAILIGSLVMGLGLALLHEAQAVTGGVAGLSFITTYLTDGNLGLIFFLINIPFYAFALWRMGWRFTARTIVTVLLISTFVNLHDRFIGFESVNQPFAIIVGSTLAGLGMIVVFRHHSSAGGFGIVAVYAQERLGLRAGYVQMSLDAVVLLLSFLVATPLVVLYSLIGVIVLNSIIAMNHRPGRYRP